MIVLAVVVAVFFIINTVLAESFDFDVVTAWSVLDVLMLIGLVVGLVFNFAAKRDAKGPAASEAVTRQYLEVNVLFYSTVVVTILFSITGSRSWPSARIAWTATIRHG